MNPLLGTLHPYPFERLRELTRDLTPNPALRPISLGIGEPRHPTPKLVTDALIEALPGLANYPATAGEPALREACAQWVQRRYGVALDPATQVLPVNGSREALFAFAQTVIDATRPGATVVCPNPFYQIYEGAALLAGACTAFANSDPGRNFAADWSQINAAMWARTQLLYVCSPGNPTGAVMPLAEWQALFELSDRHGFVIASDECYSEIYFDEAEPPVGLLQICAETGRHDYRNCVVFHSLSKRSNVPGLRSGFVAGDASLLKPYLLYRTYHGSAMPVQHQWASIMAWLDEGHVIQNRALYRQKFKAFRDILDPVLPLQMPDAGFYFWADTPSDDESFARLLYAQAHVTVLPGRYLGRTVDGLNPGENRVRMALVASLSDCVAAAERIKALL